MLLSCLLMPGCVPPGPAPEANASALLQAAWEKLYTGNWKDVALVSTTLPVLLACCAQDTTKHWLSSIHPDSPLPTGRP